MKKQEGRKLVSVQIKEEIYRLTKMTANYQGRTIGEVMDDALLAYINENLPLERTVQPEK